MKNLQKLLFAYWPIFIIFVMWCWIVIANYQPGTWLIGWDSLLPELDFQLNVMRSLTGTWQEYQGLGIAGGMAHSADLIRQLFLWLLSTFLPANLLRYTWHFLMLMLGPIGAYFLSSTLLNNHSKQKKTGALLTAIFYLFNLATVQYFYVPYETFSTFYGFLPWVIAGFIGYLEKPSAKTLLFIAVITLISTPAYYVQTMFVVLLVVLSLFSLGHLFFSQTSFKRNLFTHFKGYLFLGLINLFWLLPVIYFTFTTVTHTTQSKQNLLSTPEVSLLNQGAGSFLNLMTLKGYWFEYLDQDVNLGETVFLLESWRTHTQHSLIQTLGVILFIFAFLGILFYIHYDKQKWKSRSLLIVFLTSLVMISAGRGVIGWPYRIASLHLPLFAQIFRTAFTKWSMVTALCFALGLGQFVNNSAFLTPKENFGKSQFTRNIISLLLALILCLFSIIITLPVLQGQLFSQSMRLVIPQEYFSLFSFLNTQDSQQRIVHLPSFSFWGWQFNDWGYKGSGFIWYGIKQSILDRNFDVWSPHNEQFYSEMKYALNDSNAQLLSKVMSKYDVGYVIFDSSIVTFDIKNSNGVSKDQLQLIKDAGGKLVWHQGKLSLFSFSNKNTHGFFEFNNSSINVDANLSQDQQDSIYSSIGDYVLDSQDSTISFPFIGLSAVVPTEQRIIYSYQLKAGHYKKLELPTIIKDSIYTGPALISYFNDEINLQFLSPGIITIGNTQVELPKPDNISLKLKYQPQSIGLDINGQFLSIGQNNEKQVWIEEIKIGSYLLVRLFDANLAVISEKTIEVEKLAVLEEFTIHNLWRKTTVPTVIEIDKSATKIVLELKINSLEIPFPSIEGMNCDPFVRGDVFTSIDENNYQFETKNFGSLCTAIKLIDTNTNQDYWLKIAGDNTKGRPLKLFINETETQQVVVEELTALEKYESSLYLPRFHRKNNTYSINFNTRSMGGEHTRNNVSSMHLISVPFSMQWLQSIKLITEPNLPGTNNISSINQVKKIGTGFYKLQLTNDRARDSWLTLSQSYDPGWIALGNNKATDKSIIQKSVANSWKNAWLITSEFEELFIVYLPQLAHFTCYVVTFLSLVIVARVASKKK